MVSVYVSPSVQRGRSVDDMNEDQTRGPEELGAG